MALTATASLLTIEVQVAEAEHRKHERLTLKVANGVEGMGELGKNSLVFFFLG